MTDAQKRFVELERQKETVKKYFDELNAACETLAKEVGVNGFFQDDQGIVYQVVIPEGKFVYFEKISYIRTRRPNEKRGDLSMEKAKNAGFQLPNNG